jgi:hypothetical protein
MNRYYSGRASREIRFCKFACSDGCNNFVSVFKQEEYYTLGLTNIGLPKQYKEVAPSTVRSYRPVGLYKVKIKGEFWREKNLKEALMA